MTSFTQENLGRGDQKVRELLIIVVEEMGDYVKKLYILHLSQDNGHEIINGYTSILSRSLFPRKYIASVFQ